MNRRLLTLTAGALLLAGCSGGATPVTPAPVLKFGETVTYADGLALTVGAPERFTPSPAAFTMSKATTFVKFRVTLKNGTAAVFQTSSLRTTMQSGGTDVSADDVYDGEVATWPKSPVLPGAQLTWVKGWGVPDAAALQLSVTAGARPETIFSSH